MFRSILVPLDGSGEAAGALSLARTLARATGGRLHLLTVLSDRSPTALAAANAYLCSLAAAEALGGVGADTNIRIGDVASEIVAVAESAHVDLIAMATRAMGPQSIVALTSVAEQVVTRAPCPVLLTRHGDRCPERIGTVLVPVDGSPGGALAVAAAHALARAAASRIVLLHVVVPVSAAALATLPGMTLGGYVDSGWDELARSAGHAYVDPLARGLQTLGVAVEARVTTGDVAAEVLRCADETDADMVVMSSHAASWPARAYVGGFADRILRCGRRPVMLVKREPRP